MKAGNIPDQMMLEPILHVWRPLCNARARREKELYAINTSALIWRQGVQKDRQAWV